MAYLPVGSAHILVQNSLAQPFFLISGGLTRRQLQLMEDLEVTFIAGTPSYTLVVAETTAVEGVDLRRRMKLRVC
jgi:phenylacetate-coenzyme A ligase PaaK-like adenylate-forming protein